MTYNLLAYIQCMDGFTTLFNGSYTWHNDGPSLAKDMELSPTCMFAASLLAISKFILFHHHSFHFNIPFPSIVPSLR